MQKGFSAVLGVIVGVCILIVAAGAFLLLRPSSSSQVQSLNQTTDTAQSGMPDMKVTDMSPNTPTNQKTAVVIQHSDSTFEKYEIPTSLVQNFISSLPKTEKVVSQTPDK